jgi:hypothetical protein
MQGTDWHKRIPICGPVRLSWVAIRAPKNSDAVDGNSVALQNHPPEFHRFVAQSELERGGNLQRGAIHLAWLLSLAPNNPSIQLLEQCLQVTGDDHLSLYPESGTGHRHNACEAVREYILARLGRLPEAIDLLVAVVSANQEAAYLEAWALNWLKPARAVESVPPQTVLKLFLVVLQRYPESRLVTAVQQRELDCYVAIARRWVYSGDLLCAFGNGAKSCGPCWWVLAGLAGRGCLGGPGNGAGEVAGVARWRTIGKEAAWPPWQVRSDYGGTVKRGGESAAVAKASAGQSQQRWGCERDAVWPSMDVCTPVTGSWSIWTGGRREPGRCRRLRWNSPFRRWRNLRFEFPSGRGGRTRAER